MENWKVNEQLFSISIVPVLQGVVDTLVHP